MSFIFFIALVLLVIFLALRLKDVVAILIMSVGVLLYGLIFLWLFDKSPISLFAGFGAVAGIIAIGYYFQNKSWQKRKKANDEYGHAVWLKAEAERLRQKQTTE